MTNENTPSNDLDNDLIGEEIHPFGAEWIAAHLLAIIIFLEDKFGDTAGHVIGGIAADLLKEFTNPEQETAPE
jgi:hypothetical protein